jgi:hypothetical protein
VFLHPDAREELAELPRNEKAALDNVMTKLQALGPALGYPHCSHVQGAEDLRELRPRAGRSRWRAFYRRVGEIYVVAAIGPEAEVDRRGFRRSITAAEDRAGEVDTE